MFALRGAVARLGVEVKSRDKKRTTSRTYTKTLTFPAFGSKVYEDVPEPGWSFRSAEIKLADGTIAPGIVMLCDKDSGEHYDTFFILKNEIVSPSDSNFLVKMRRRENQIYPYHYRYAGFVPGDHHIVPGTGWSR